MDRIGIRELRADVAAQVRRAGDGHRGVITVPGPPAAPPGPLEPQDPPPSAGDPAADPATTLPLWAGTRIDQLVREVRGR